MYLFLHWYKFFFINIILIIIINIILSLILWLLLYDLTFFSILYLYSWNNPKMNCGIYEPHEI